MKTLAPTPPPRAPAPPREEGYETLMVNCNPETVSTDYGTSDRLYFEPLTREDVLEIVDAEKPEAVIVPPDALAGPFGSLAAQHKGFHALAAGTLFRQSRKLCDDRLLTRIQICRPPC